MPALYLNHEVGACATEEEAKQCITRTMTAYTTLKDHISDIYQEQETFKNLQLCSERGKALFITQLLSRLDRKTQTIVTIFIKELSKGSITHPSEKYTKTLKILDVPSPFLEYVLEQEGMALSFASDTYWEADFIEFNQCDSSIPNIWGQTNFQPINDWLNLWYKKTTSIFNRIKKDFDIEFCCTDITETSFTPHEWKMIYDTFYKAAQINFTVSPPLIKDWSTLPIFYIRDKNHSNFTLRIFFIKQESRVYIGEIYHKNSTNTLKEENAAEKSYKKFCDLKLL